MKQILFALAILSSLYSLRAQTGTLTGRITDELTEESLIGATVLLEGTTLGTTTDIDGYFTITGIPPKTYNIKASYLGYTTQTLFNIVVRSGNNPDVNFAMSSGAVQLETAIVRPNPFAKDRETPLSIQKLSQEEIAAYPGGNNDVAKVVQSLPGVGGSVGGFRNDVIVRGGAPNENVYYLDGVEIPSINHFSTQGSAGGPVGLLNVSFFEGVSLTTSSFGAQYDNALSSVLQFQQRDGNDRRFAGNFRLGASETALTLEGPLFKGQNERSKTTFLVSGRRSYLQFLFDLIGLPFLPDYWDYQYKITHRADDYNTFTFTGVGSIDDFSVNDLEDADPEERALQEQVPVIRQRTNALGLTWKRRFKDNSGLMQTTISTNRLNNEFQRFSDNVAETGLLFRNDASEQETKLRYRYTRFLGNWTLAGGFSTQFVNYRNNTNDLINDFNFNSELDFWRYGLFAQATSRLVNDRLGVSFGLRMDGNSFTDSGNELLSTLSPRLALSYQLTDDGRWTANFSLGRYYKIPPYTILGFQNNAGNFVNQSADYIRSDHLVAGFEYLLNESSRITVEGFLKRYEDYPVSIQDSVSLANKGGGFEVLGNEPIASVGKGRSYGVEFLFQQKFSGNFYAVASYTLFRSEFTGFDQSTFTPSVWDNRHLISLLGGVKFGKNWEASARYRYLGTAPLAPVDTEASLATYPALIQDFNRIGDQRLAAFSQFDLRIDKKWNFKKVSLDLYLEIQNLLNQAPADEPRYGLVRNEAGQVIEPNRLEVVNTDPQGQILPTIGAVINF
ncbi:MAG: TonB-dependent receptor [Bacteroidota bacterium]